MASYFIDDDFQGLLPTLDQESLAQMEEDLGKRILQDLSLHPRDTREAPIMAEPSPAQALAQVEVSAQQMEAVVLGHLTDTFQSQLKQLIHRNEIDELRAALRYYIDVLEELYSLMLHYP